MRSIFFGPMSILCLKMSFQLSLHDWNYRGVFKFTETKILKDSEKDFKICKLSQAFFTSDTALIISFCVFMPTSIIWYLFLDQKPVSKMTTQSHITKTSKWSSTKMLILYLRSMRWLLNKTQWNTDQRQRGAWFSWKRKNIKGKTTTGIWDFHRF